MIRPIAFIAALVGAASPAVASTNAIYSYLSRNTLIDTIEETGTNVRFNTADCTRNIMGYYALESDAYGNVTRDELGLCVAAHKGDLAELSNTLRHEAMHVAQACYGGPIAPIEELLEVATPEIHRIVGRYPAQHHHVEYEAFVAAEYFSDAEMTKVVEHFCFD